MCIVCSAAPAAPSKCPTLFSSISAEGNLVTGSSGGDFAEAAGALTVARTPDAYVNGLLGGSKWAATSITYSLPTEASHYEYGGEAQNNFRSANAMQAAAIDKALSMFEAVSGLDFTRITETASNHADVRFANSDSPPTAWAYYPSASPQGGDVWFNGSNGNYSAPTVGNYAFHTVLHELGHAMGLKHAHQTSGTFGALPTAHQSMEYTVMSYSSYKGASTKTGYTNQGASYAQSLMMDDIAALQALYGANYATNAGNTVYSWSATTGEMTLNGTGQGAPGDNRIFTTIWDGGGEDTYDFSGYTTALKVDLNPGLWTTTSIDQLADLHYSGSKNAIGNIANAKLYNKDARSLIENAVGGSGDDKITGNAAANLLDGGAGNDNINGGTGDDTLVGGAGADILAGGTGYDTLDFSLASARIAMSLLKGGTAGDAAGDRYLGFEEVIGSAFDDEIGGANLAETLFGGDGDDILWGASGYDTLTGGAGSDVFDFNTATEIGKAVRARDVITDFDAAEDRIDLSGIDANTRVTGNQDFALLGGSGARFTAAGQIRVRHETTATGETTIVEGNVDTNLTADFQIEIRGIVDGLNEAMFIL